MNVVKYIFAPWAGILLYTLLSTIFGPMGFSVYHQLQNEQRKQEANIELLKSINQELEDTTNSLLYDQDTLTIYAREQGYSAPQEQFIRIVGLGGTQLSRTSSGEVIVAAAPQFTPDRTIRIIAFCGGFITLISIAVFDILKYLRDR